MAKLNWSRRKRSRPAVVGELTFWKAPAPLRNERDTPRGPRPSARALACQQAYQRRQALDRAS